MVDASKQTSKEERSEEGKECGKSKEELGAEESGADGDQYNDPKLPEEMEVETTTRPGEDMEVMGEDGEIKVNCGAVKHVGAKESNPNCNCKDCATRKDASALAQKKGRAERKRMGLIKERNKTLGADRRANKEDKRRHSLRKSTKEVGGGRVIGSYEE